MRTRSRRRFGRSRKHGRHTSRRLRIARPKTAVVRCVFEAESQSTYQIIPGASTLSNGTTQNVWLNGWQNNGGGSQGVMYALTFPLNSLANFPIGNYKQVAQLYDWVKLYKVKVNLIPPIDPQTAVNVSNGTGIYNFTTWPLQDPVISWVDYDGWSPMPNVGSTGFVTCPSNGDMTQLVNNRPGSRRHRPFRPIRRTFYPRQIDLIASDGAGPSTTPLGVQGKRLGWMTVSNANPFTGQLCIAIPYLGQDATAVNIQPNYRYAISNKWYIGLKCPLYG
nr:MAG: capsid protein [Cressdnaviricota sp.]